MTKTKDEGGRMPGRGRSSQGWMLAGLLTVTTAMAGMAGAAFASGQDMQRMHGEQAAMDPASMDRHFDEMIGKILPDATAEQKARLKPIFASFHADMHALHAGFGEAHGRMLELVQQPR